MGLSYVAPPAAIQCSLDVEHRSANVVLRGRIVSAIETDGSYRLEIVKTSRSGSSNINQSGTFQAKANQPLFVGMANLDAGPGTRLVAHFVVRAAGQDHECKSEKEISDE